MLSLLNNFIECFRKHFMHYLTLFIRIFCFQTEEKMSMIDQTGRVAYIAVTLMHGQWSCGWRTEKLLCPHVYPHEITLI